MKYKTYAVIITIQILLIAGIFIQLQNKILNNSGGQGKSDKIGFDTIKDDLRTFNPSYALHPYLGYVLDYGTDRNSNMLGFDDTQMPIKDNKDTYVVGIVGGSVANLYSKYEKDMFIKRLTNLGLTDKKIALYSFALGGYKQPQQLMTLQYLLSLGYKFDLIINIDGFNEAALSYSENYLEDISSYFPRSWNYYSRRFFDQKTISLISKIEALKSKRGYYTSFPFGLGLIPNAMLEKAYSDSQGDLARRLKELDKTYQTKGPEPFLHLNEKGAVKDIVNVWFNSTLQMSHIAKINNFVYMEFLQPNQYLPNTKPFNKIELKKYVNLKNPYSYAARTIYPKIIDRIPELKEKGVAIFDLTNIFVSETGQIYIDDCCHYNRKGYSLITDEIMKALTHSSPSKPLHIEP